MSAEDALAFANYIATSRPQDGETFDSYMTKALARWPGLSPAEVDWACNRAAEMSERKAERHAKEADKLMAECLKQRRRK